MMIHVSFSARLDDDDEISLCLERKSVIWVTFVEDNSSCP